MPQRPVPKKGFRRERTRRSERSVAGRKPMFDELAALDSKIVGLIKERSAHLAKIRSKGGMDAADEKSIWSVWQKALPKTRGGAGIWRKLFFLIQDLEPEDESDDRGKDGFLLAPRRGAYEFTANAPASLDGMQCVAALGACSEFSISPTVVNERLVQTVKAFNQAGGGLFWETDQLAGRGATGLEFRDKSVYVGDDSLSFHLCLARALAQPGSVKFTGGHQLKTADLAELARLLPRLGGRLVNIIPGSKGLPVRLESSGQIPHDVHIPETLPQDAVLGILMAAPYYAEGLTLRCESPSSALFDTFQFAALLLRACNVQVELETAENDCAIKVLPGAPAIPATLPMDPYFGAYLLALPRLEPSRESSVSLSGSWPGQTGPYRSALALLDAAGVKVELVDNLVRATAGPPLAETPHLTCGGSARLFPLSFALAAALPEAKLDLPVSEEDKYTCFELADMLGLILEEADGALLVSNPGRKDDSRPQPWVAPNAWWAMAFASIAIRRPGQILADPSTATDLLPRFWNFYNTLPAPEKDVFFLPKREAGRETHEPERKGRRIRIADSGPRE